MIGKMDTSNTLFSLSSVYLEVSSYQLRQATKNLNPLKNKVAVHGVLGYWGIGVMEYAKE